MRQMSHKAVWMPLAILLLTWGAYFNSLGNGFHYDDTHSIVENPHIRSLGNIPRFFADPSAFSREPAMAMYRPVLLTTYALNYAMGGYQVWGYHLVNLVLHGTMALLVFWILRDLGMGWLAWWGGIVFGIHPINSQAVNYISSRSELLAGLGVLVAFYLVAVRRDHKGWALVAYGLALLSKSTAVVLLPLLVLREWILGREQRRWKSHLPFGAMTLVYLMLIAGNRFLTRSLAQEVRPYGEHVLTQLKALVFYLQLISMPVRLSVDHAFTVSRSPLEGAVLGSGLLVGSLVFLGWRARDWGGWGTGWVLAGLGLTFWVPLNVLVNEHRLYLSGIGLLMVSGAYLGKGKMPNGAVWIGGGMLLILAILTWQRNAVWKDEYTLWKDAVDRAPGMFRAQSNWGLALYERGDWDGALTAFEKAARLNPRYAKTWNNMGLVHEEKGRFFQAIQAYARALELRPNLAGTHANLGRLQAQVGRHREAEELLLRALEIDPYSVEARLNLGRVYQRQGRLEEAVRACEQALEIDPGSAAAHNNLGLLRVEMGHDTEAQAALEKAVELDPEYEEARINLQVLRLQREGKTRRQVYEQLVREFPRNGIVWNALGEELGKGGDWIGAASAYEEALRGYPQASGIHLRLGAAYRRSGRLEKAIGAYVRGMETEPGNIVLHNNLTSAYAAAGRLNEALEICRRALDIDPENTGARDNWAALNPFFETAENVDLTDK